MEESPGEGVANVILGMGTCGHTRRMNHLSALAAPSWPKCIRWSGEVPALKWMNFYAKVLSKFVTGPGLRLTVSVEVDDPKGIPPTKIEETKAGLRELGLGDEVETE